MHVSFILSITFKGSSPASPSSERKSEVFPGQNAPVVAQAQDNPPIKTPHDKLTGFYQFWSDELHSLGKNFFLFKRFWSKEDMARLVSRLNDGLGLPALGWDFDSEHSDLPYALIKRLGKLRSGYQSTTLSAAASYAVEWLQSKTAITWRLKNARYRDVQGATEPNLPPVALLHPEYTTVEVTKAVFASCLTACDATQVFADHLSNQDPMKALQNQLRRAASSLVAMEVFNQWDAVSLDGSRTMDVTAVRDRKICLSILGSYDDLTAKFDMEGEPILYPLPPKAEPKKKAAVVPFTHELDAYENLRLD
ncbi:hypothetical protein P7C70_g5029, partial [Phenoliferia sp. Uapishka_3]